MIEDIFALLLLLSDGYLRLKARGEGTRERNAIAFFAAAKRLPQELQMVLIKRVYFSPGIFYLSHQTEKSLKKVLSYPFPNIS